MSFQTQSLTAHLAKLRHEKRLSQRQMAIQLQMPQSHLSNIENGKTDPRLSNFVELARFLGSEVMLVPLDHVSVVNALIDPTTKNFDSRKPRWAFDSDEDE
jgi:HTH-type transcriptional regulator/antitoxin HipB